MVEMANTQLSEIYDLFMMTVDDYRLRDLFNTSQPDFEDYLQAWLDFAIVDFFVCDQDLNYDNIIKEFPAELSRENKIILATLMMKYWLQKAVQDVTQFNLHITDRDFKMASEAQNLREKSNHLNMVKEQCSQLLQDYGYKKNDWTNWYNQSFSGI
jgi:hypothetical protein